MSYLRNNPKVSYRCFIWSRRSFGLDEHIIDVDFHGLGYPRLKYLGYQPLVSFSDVFKAKGRYIVTL